MLNQWQSMKQKNIEEKTVVLQKVIIAKQRERIKSYSSALPKEKSKHIDIQLPKPRGVKRMLIHIQDKMDRRESERLWKIQEEEETRKRLEKSE